MKKIVLLLLNLILIQLTQAQFAHPRVYSTFDNLPLTGLDTFNNGSDGSTSIDHYSRHFLHAYDTMFNSWSGWALSNGTDDSSRGFENQYSSVSGGGISGTPNYMVAFFNPVIVLDEAIPLSGMYVNNTTYAYYDMLEGSSFSKKFGGEDGSEPDYFYITIKIYKDGIFVDSSDFYLADFRFSNAADDYIIKDWTFWDFNNDLENDIMADSLVFSFQSSDTGQFGINTPSFFCMDDFNAMSSFKKAKASWMLGSDSFYNGSDGAGGFQFGYIFFGNSYDDQWNSWTGWAASTKQDTQTSGFGNQYSPISKQVWYTNYVLINYGQDNQLRGPLLNHEEHELNSLYKLSGPAPWPMTLHVTNTSYGYFDMLYGSSFSKKFGGSSGNDEDYFRLVMTWLDYKDSVIHLDTVYLADFRFSDNSKDFIVNNWITVKSKDDYLGKAQRITFHLESSDTGQFGMNTPASFALSIWYNVPSSISEQNIQFSLYPNPSQDQVTVESAIHIHKMEIFDIKGQKVREAEGNTASVRGLHAGVYFVSIHTDRGVYSRKIMVE